MFSVAGRARGLLTAGLTLLLVACGGDSSPPADEAALEQGDPVERSRREQVAAERRERLRQRAAADNEADFTYFRYRIDVAGETPTACFVFSRPLDPETDYDPYLEFRPAFKPALSVEGRELCVGGLSFGDERTAILKSGLPSQGGETLARGEEVPIDFADRPPYVGFKGAGVILPREDADGLPIETVNVDEVTVTVSYVPDRVLYDKSVSQGVTVSEGGYGNLYGDERASDVAEEIWSGSMAIENVQNAPVVTVFPLPDVIGELRPGAYFVEVADAKEQTGRRNNPASAKRWIVMTNLALTAYRGEHGLDLTLRSLRDGQEIVGADVQLVARNNDILAEGETDAEGRVGFADPVLSGTGNAAPKLVMAYGARGDIAVLDLTRAPVDLSELETGGRTTPGPVDGYLYTERGIYRPGETVHVTAMMRDRAGVRVDDRAGSLIVYRPNGLKAEELRFSESEAGAHLLDYQLARDAARGEWRAVLDIDGMGQAGSVSFSVEDFVPQRIAVELAGDEETPVRAGETREIAVEARFLYGAPGAGLTVESRARIEPDPSPFEAFGGFGFGRHDEQFREQVVEMPVRTTDGAGKAVARIEPGRRGSGSPRPLRLNTVVSVLEPGGRAVSESVRIPYRPRDLYLGIRPEFDGRVARDAPARFELAAVGADGASEAAELNWKLVEIDYHYDWYREGERWRWRRSRTVTTVNEGVARTEAGATASISVDGLDWGRHELTVTGPDGAEASHGFNVGWGGRVSEDGVEAPDRVQVSLTDERVQPGGTAEFTIVPPYDGDAQIVVATDRILSVETRPVSAEGTRVTLPVTDEWGEGAYLMVNVYSERDPVLDARPGRAVGVAYAPVNMDERTFDLTISAPDIVRPRQEQLIEVDIENGPREPVFLTLAAVDQGILNLTKFESPDPVSYYFGKKALGVSLHDDYGRLLNPNLGLPAEVRTGGDQLGGEGLSVVPTRTVSLYSGLVEVGRSRSAKIRFEIPDFNGELRLMAVAWSREGLGAADRSVTVRDRAPSELILPRFLAPGDEAVVTASIDNVELEDGRFNARLSAAGPVDVAGGEITRQLPRGARADVPIRVEAGEAGVSRLRLDVEGPEGFDVSHDYRIQTRSPYLPVTRVSRAMMAPGETFGVSPELTEGLVPGSVGMTVSFSSLPMDEGALYASLARYPYGCTEQAISRAMPLVYAQQLVELGAEDDGRDARTQVQQAVTRVLNRQSADGAFGLWREGDGSASPWLGAYTTDFLHRAKAAGYSVPDEAMDRAYGALQTVATGDAWRVYGYDREVHESEWHDDTQARLMHRASAYALYVLAKAGRADLSRLRYMHDRELDKIDSPLARAHLGAALAVLDDRARAASAFDAAEQALGYRNTGDYYQTPLRDLAGILALAGEAGFTEFVDRLSARLGDDAPDPEELTTQEKAFALLAVNALTDGDPGKFRMKTEGLGRGSDNDRRYFLAESQISPDVSFTYEGETAVYRTVMVSGAPQEAPAATAQDLGVRKRFTSLTGQGVNLEDLRQGERLVAIIELFPEENRRNPVILADLLPAGFEIETILRTADGDRRNADSGPFAWMGEISEVRTAEARDDRFVAAVDLFDEPARLAYVVRAVTQGNFAMPGAVAEDMYRPEVNARSEPGRIAISPREGGTGGKP